MIFVGFIEESPKTMPSKKTKKSEKKTSFAEVDNTQSISNTELNDINKIHTLLLKAIRSLDREWSDRQDAPNSKWDPLCLALQPDDPKRKKQSLQGRTVEDIVTILDEIVCYAEKGNMLRKQVKVYEEIYENLYQNYNELAKTTTWALNQAMIKTKRIQNLKKGNQVLNDMRECMESLNDAIVEKNRIIMEFDKFKKIKSLGTFATANQLAYYYDLPVKNVRTILSRAYWGPGGAKANKPVDPFLRDEIKNPGGRDSQLVWHSRKAGEILEKHKKKPPPMKHMRNFEKNYPQY